MGLRPLYAIHLGRRATEIFAMRLKWYDRCGKLAAECKAVSEKDSVNAVKRYHHNAYSEEILREEFAKAPTLTPTVSTTLAQLDQAIVRTPGEDRYFSTEYDLLGQKTKETRGNELVKFDPETEEIQLKTTYQQLNNLTLGVSPSYSDAPAEEGLSKLYEYNAIGKNSTTTYEDGSTEYNYYDARGLQTAKAAVPRKDFSGNTLIPLTEYNVNIHGQQVKLTRYKKGTASADSNGYALPDQNDNDNQTELTYFDNRGLAAYKQDAEGYVNGFTYSPSRKIGRQWWRLTNINENTHIDEKRFSVDELGRILTYDLWRDGQLQQRTQSYYSAFSEPIFEGPGDGSKPVYRKYDVAGNLWATNKEFEGFASIKLFDINGQDTATLRSPTKDLNIEYTQLSNTLQFGPADLERTEKTRDPAGRVTFFSSPERTQATKVTASDIPLNTLVSQGYEGLFDSSKTCITWVIPQERIATPTFTIWPVDHKELAITLDIVPQNGRCGVDVSSLATDVYQYEIDYNLTDPIHKNNVHKLYSSSGKVQFDTGNSQNSKSLVVTVKDNSLLQLTGNTTSVTGIELWQNNQKIATINNVDQQHYQVDLSSYPSGQYTIKPITSNNQELSVSLPFTIYTPIPAKQPLAIEIPCEVYFSSLDSHVQLVSLLPPEYIALPAKVTITYLDDQDNQRTQELTDISLTTFKEYTDSQNNSLDYNLLLDYPAKTIQSLSLALKLKDNTYFPLMANVAPANVSAQIEKIEKTISSTTNNNSKEILEDDFVLIEEEVKKESKKTSLQDDWTLIDDEEQKGSSQKTKSLKEITKAGAGSSVIHTPFTPRLVLHLTGLPNLVKPPMVEFKNTSLGQYGNWQQIVDLGTTKEGVVLDATSIPPGRYPFKLLYTPEQTGNTNAVAPDNNVFEITRGGVIYSSDAQPAAPKISLRATSSNLYDNWNNLISTTDSLNNNSRYKYNEKNQQVQKIQPEVDVIDINGNSSKQTPTTNYAYNERGFKIAEQDPNRNTRAFNLNAAGQKLWDVLGDGTLSRGQDFDALGRVWRYTDAHAYFQYGGWGRITYDHNNQITKQISPFNRTTTYELNELGYCRRETDNGDATRVCLYDINNNVTRRIEPMTQQTDYYYERNGKVTAINYPDSSSVISTYDSYFPILLGHRDRGNAVYTYEYDKKGQKKHQTCTGGLHGDNIPRFSYITDTGYVVNEAPLPGQDLTLNYDAGLLISVIDNALRQNSEYDYDSEGQRTAARLRLSNGVLIRDARTVLDGLGREIWAFDTMMVTTTGYDANSNRRHVTGALYTKDWKNYTDSQDYWYTYDQADRVLIDRGALQNSQIVQSTGMLLGYANGLRASQNQGGITTTLSYDPDSLLVDTYAPGANSHRVYDDTGGFVKYYSANDRNGNLARNDIRNGNGWQFNDYQGQTGVGWQNTDYSEFSATGYPAKQQTHYDTGCYDDMTMSYVGFEDFKIRTIGGQRKYHKYDGDYSSCSRAYDSNGNIWSVTGVQQGTVAYANTYDGLVLQRWIFNPQKPNPDPHHRPSGSTVYEGQPTCYVYTVNGQYMGSYKLDIADPYNPKGKLNMDYIRHGVGRQGGFEVSNNFRNGASQLSGQWPSSVIFNQYSSRNADGQSYFRGNDVRARYPVDLSIADPIRPVSIGVPAPSDMFASLFKHGNKPDPLTALNEGATFPPLASASMMPNNGSNYSQLAEIAYGDSSYESMLETHDGQPSLAAPVSLPPIVPMYNKASTYIPRDQVLQQMAVAFYPVMKAPNMDDDNWFDEFVGFVAIAVATIVAGPVGFSVTAALEAAAVATAIDLAGQYIGERLGLTDHFSLQEGLETGLQAGFSEYFGAGALGQGITQQAIQQAMLSAGETAVAEQLTEMALGWRHSFDVKSVAASIISAAMSTSLGKTLPQGLAAEESANLAGTVTSSLIAKQNLELEDLAATALGTGTVHAIKAQMQARAEQQERQREVARYEAAVAYMDSLGASAENQSNAQSVRMSRAARFTQQSSQTNRDNQSKWSSIQANSDIVNQVINESLGINMPTSLSIGSTALTIAANNTGSTLNRENSGKEIDILEGVNSSSRDTVTTFAAKYAPSYFNMANNYYSQILSGYNQQATLNLYNELDPTSAKIPLLQAETKAFMGEIEQLTINARSWNSLGTLTNAIGTAGKSLNPLIEMVSSVREYTLDPTYRNASVISGGIAGGALASQWGEKLIFGEAAEFAVAAVAAPEIGLALGAVALGALGIFAGKEIGGFIYDAPQIAENSARKINQWLKNN